MDSRQNDPAPTAAPALAPAAPRLIKCHTCYGANYGPHDPQGLGRGAGYLIPGALTETARRDREDGFATMFHQLSGHRAQDELQIFDMLVTLTPARRADLEAAFAANDCITHDGGWLPPRAEAAMPNGACAPINLRYHAERIKAQLGALWKMGAACIGLDNTSHWAAIPGFVELSQAAEAMGRKVMGELLPITAADPQTHRGIPGPETALARWWGYSRSLELFLDWDRRWFVPVGTVYAAFTPDPVGGHMPTPEMVERFAARGILPMVWEHCPDAAVAQARVVWERMWRGAGMGTSGPAREVTAVSVRKASVGSVVT